MIQIEEKKNCCGCNACVQVCPRQCIAMQEDNEGFLYPHVDEEICINCHLCEKVCPALNQSKPREPLKVYAAINKDEKIRMESSSGGIFTALAERIIDEGGVVFGACFDNKWDVVHDYVETKEELRRFRGSKYVQSRIEDNYRKVESFLKAGRKVLFTGTPCQIAGLKLLLGKSYDNLLAVDFVCHGVPSPGVWRRYLKEEIARQCDRKNTVLPRPIHEKDVRVDNISFRNKTLGWKKYSFALDLSTTNGSGEKFSFALVSPLTKNEYLRGFINNIYLRPICYNCPFKKVRSESDITLGDFWNISSYCSQLDDNRGISLLLSNSEKGTCSVENIYDYTNLYDISNYDTNRNFALMNSVILTDKRSQFYDLYRTQISFIKTINDVLKLSFKETIKLYWSKIKRRLKI